jgi:hypothetical protein
MVPRPFVAGGGKTPLNQEEAAEKLGVPDISGETTPRARAREGQIFTVASTVQPVSAGAFNSTRVREGATGNVKKKSR